MIETIERPSTPLPMPYGDVYPLTPPRTAGFDKRNTFAINDQAKPNSKRENNRMDCESPASFFEDYQEGSEVEVEGGISDAETIPTLSDSSPVSPASTISFATKIDTLSKSEPFVSSVTALTGHEPFPFLRLPLSVRNQVYEHLLVVPALICVRQNHTIPHDQDDDRLHTECRDIAPGIAYALAQLAVDGYKARFSRFASTNSNILLASKEVYVEARAVLYGKNNFEIVKPSTELSPPTDFSVRLFPTGCQRLVTKLNIRIRSFYDLHRLFSGGYNVIKNYYRGLDSLTLILELQSTGKGFNKQWAKQEGETSTIHVKRLQAEIAQALFGAAKAKKVTKVPARIDLCILFSGESYHEKLNSAGATANGMAEHEQLRSALTDAWGILQKGGART